MKNNVISNETQQVTNFLGECYHVLKTEDYMVDIRYGQKDWNMISALREIIANMLDTKAEYKLYWKDGVACISDKGTGLPRKAFIIGASSKSEDTQAIGQFGEGLKMALITCLRENRRISISTIGYGAEVSKLYSDEYETEIMHLMFTDNTQEIGTTIKIECTEEEYDGAVDLFLQLKEGYTKIENNIFLPRGYVCLMGLKTEENPNLLFSYDLTDKSVTNRDRNAVKSKLLKSGMEKILNGIKNQKTVRAYFEGLEEMPEADEYKIALNPKYKDTWLTVLKKMYGEKIAYSTTIENDIKATTNGYKVLRGQSKAVAKTLANLGIKSSKEGSKGVKAANAMLVEEKEKKITYPIAKSYAQDWTIIESGREFLANAIDVSNNQADITYKDGYCYITDKGIGITRQNFVLGNSHKADEQIGMFGEGFKLAALVVAREERNPKIETVGYTYYPKIENNEEFSTELFTISYETNKRTEGTVTSFKATEEEVEAIKSLFLQFTQDQYAILTTDIVDLIVDNRNSIYVNGLRSAQVESVFSYNIKDKKIVNSRDRNSVDNNKLSSYVTEVLNDLTDKSAILKLLLDWEISVYQLEYKLVLNPKHLSIWKEVIDKEFAKSCLVSYEYPENNAIAKQAGYRILSEIPPYIKEILTRCNVATADEIAEEYAKSGVHIGNKLIYPITTDYVNTWTLVRAETELLSNALDTDTEVTATCTDGIIEINDKGEGLKLKSLLLGGGDKNIQDDKIGIFGEGLKLAALLLTKQQRQFKLETVGFTIVATTEVDEEFDAELLVFTIEPNHRTQGTRITFRGTEVELQQAKDNFIKLSDKFKKVASNIYTPGGYVLINGVVVEEVESCYSYNIPKSEKLSRDRNSISSLYRNPEVVKLINSITDKDVMKNILNALNSDKNILENQLGYELRIRKNKKKWYTVAQDVFKKCCLPDRNEEYNLVAQDEGFEVFYYLPTALKQVLVDIGFPTASSAIKLLGDEGKVEDVIDVNELSESAREKWLTAMKIILKEYGQTYEDKILICGKVRESQGGQTEGLYSKETDTCYIVKDVIENESLGYILGIVAHEICHRETGAFDRTRQFENFLTEIIGNLLDRLYA